jgi:hypothetical protein
VFQLVFNWLLTEKVYSQLTPEDRIPVKYSEICQLYVFGDARGIPELCNATVDLRFPKSAQD